MDKLLLLLFNYNRHNNSIIILMREQRWKEMLILELGDLKETVSTKRNGRLGRGLQKNFFKGGVRVHTSLLPLLLPPHRYCHCYCCHCVVMVLVVVVDVVGGCSC